MKTAPAESTHTHPLSPQAHIETLLRRVNAATWKAMEAKQFGAPDAALLELEARVARLDWLIAVSTPVPSPGLIARYAECEACFRGLPLDLTCTCREHEATGKTLLCTVCKLSDESGPEHTCQPEESDRDESDRAMDAADAANDEALLGGAS